MSRFRSALAAGAAALAVAASAVLVAPAAPAQAAPNQPFDCVVPTFFAQALDVGTAQLYRGEYVGAASSWSPIATTTGYNALGFNPADRFLYAMQPSGQVVRIDQDGGAVNVAGASGYGSRTLWDSGTFDAAGSYYATTRYNAPNNPITVISGLAGGTVTSRTIALPAGVQFADFSFKGDYLWAANYNQGGSRVIYRIDPRTNPASVVSVAMPAEMPTSAYGASFTLNNGNLAFISGGTGARMYQVAIANPASAAPTASVVSSVSAPNNSQSDAAICTAQPANLTVAKTGPSAVTPGSAISWDVTIANAASSPGASSGFTLTDQVPAGVTGVSAQVTQQASATSTTACTTAGNAVTCNGGLIMPGQQVVVRVSGTAPSTVGSIANTATVVANEPNASGTSTFTSTPASTQVGDVSTVTANDIDLGDLALGASVLVSADASTTGGFALAAPTVAAGPAAGQGSAATVASTGQLRYTAPASGFSGNTSFTYRSCNTAVPQACDTGVVTARIRNAFTPGSASVSGVSVPQNGDVAIPVADVVSATGSPVGSMTAVSGPGHGTLEPVPGGGFRYTPAPGYTGSDTVTFRACDTATPQECIDIEVPIAVGANTVTAVDDTATTTVDERVDIVVRDDDSSATGTPLETTPRVGADAVGGVALAAPADGSVSVQADGRIRYTPAAGFSGVDRFEYQICDTSTPTRVCDVAEVVVTVQNVVTPGAASAAQDGVATPHRTPREITLAEVGTATGAALDGSTLALVGGQPAGATVTFVDGEVVVTPTGGFTGEVPFRVSVRDASDPSQTHEVDLLVTVLPNVVSARDHDVEATAGGQVPVTLATGAASQSGQPLAPAAVVTDPQHGTVSVAGGVATYMPDALFSGDDSFAYRVCDTSTPTPACDDATVRVTVQNVFAQLESAFAVGPRESIATSVSELVSAAAAPIAAVGDGGVSVVSGPRAGGIAIDPDGTIRFVPPAATWSGTESYTFRFVDTSAGTPQSVEYVVAFAIGANSVVARDYTALETGVGDAVVLPVLADATSAAASAQLVIGEITQPATGTATVAPSADGRSLVVSPVDGFSGAVSFRYEVCDDSVPTAVCDTATVDLLVANELDPGAAAAAEGGVSTPHREPRTIALDELGTTTGAALDASTLALVGGQPVGATVTFVDGEVVVTPAGGFTGPVRFTVTVQDESSPAQSHEIELLVTVLPNVVTLEPQSLEVAAGGSLAIDVAAGEVSQSGQPFAGTTVAVAPVNGTLTPGAQRGRFDYAPADGFSGTDSFEFRTCDTSTPTAVCAVETVTILVVNGFAQPASGFDVVAGGTRTLSLGELVTTTGAPVADGGVAIVDGDPDRIAIGADGSVVYTPRPGFAGTERVTLRFTDTSVPDAQEQEFAYEFTVAANVVTAPDFSRTAPLGQAVRVPALASSTSASAAATLAYGAIGTPSGDAGSAAVDADTGELVFTPTPTFSGRTSFDYVVCDDSIDRVCDTATVVVTVQNAWTDGPASAGTLHNRAVSIPVADIVTTAGASVDARAAQLTVLPGAGQPQRGSVSTVDGAFRYTPRAGSAGVDSFDVRICDTSSPVQCVERTVTVDVAPNIVTADPRAETVPAGSTLFASLLDGGESASGQPLAPVRLVRTPAVGEATISNGVLTYRAPAGFSGDVTLDYQVCDTSDTAICSTATVSILVENVFRPGVAVEPGLSTPQNTPITVPLSDIVTAGGAPLAPGSVRIVGGPSHGVAEVDPETGAVRYTPAEGYSGTDAVEVEVCDTSLAEAQCTTLTIALAVSANVVTANADAARTPVGTSVEIDVRRNDVTATGQALAVPVISTPPANGRADVLASGLVRYTPAAGFSGVDTFEYRVCDTSSPAPVCAVAIVAVTVPNEFAPGQAVVRGASTPQSTAVAIPLDSITTPSGRPVDPASVRVVAGPGHGTATVDPATGAITYTPQARYSGADEIRVEVCDVPVEGGEPECSTLAVPVRVAANVVTAGDDEARTGQGSAVRIELGGNDVSASGRPLGAPRIVTAPRHGDVTFDGSTAVYTPHRGFTGVDSFTYERCDDSLPTPVCSVATVRIQVVSGLASTGTTLAATAGGGALALLLAGGILLGLRRRREVRAD